MRQRQISKARRSALARPMNVTACLAALSLAVSVSPASGSVTIGQLDPAPNTELAACSGAPAPAFDWLQPRVTSGTSFVVPQMPPATSLVVSSWSHNASAGPPQTLAMKVFRPVAFPAVYMAVGHDGPQPLASGTLNTFPANVPVKPGDVLGLNSYSPHNTACFRVVSGDSTLQRMGTLADGQSGDFNTGSNQRLNISAVVAPANAFTLGDVRRNKKKGTAILTVDVPNPGELALSGTGVKGARARAAATVPAAGKVALLVKPKGKKKRKLNETGKVKVTLSITYTPTGGEPRTQAKKLKLKKR